MVVQALDGCFNDILILSTGHLCPWCLLHLPGSSAAGGAGSCGLLQAQAGPSHREAAQEDAHEVEGDGWQVICTAGHTAAHLSIAFCSWLLIVWDDECYFLFLKCVLTCSYCFFFPFAQSPIQTLNVSRVGSPQLLWEVLPKALMLN